MRKNKLLALLLCALLVMALAACGGSGSSSEAASGGAEGGGQVQGLTEPIAEQPALLSSVGQSADVEMVKTMLERGGIDFNQNNLATSADLAGNKTLILAVGGSSKGLGAAGIDADQELARVSELIGAAQDAGLTIIVLHIGGEARRGDLSDKFINPTFEIADYAIVVEDGDGDGLMSGYAASKGYPMDMVASMTDAIEPLAAAFK